MKPETSLHRSAMRLRNDAILIERRCQHIAFLFLFHDANPYRG